MDLEQTISQIREKAAADLEAASTMEAIEAVRVEMLGRKGKLAEISKQFGKLTPEERARIGKLLNEVKDELEKSIGESAEKVAARKLELAMEAEWIDLTSPAPGPRPGSLHPVTQVQREIEDLFVSLG